MWNFLWFLMEQTEKEKQMTYLGVTFLFLMLFVFVLDTMAKGKVFPTKGPIKQVLVIACVIVAAVVILLTFVYK